MEKSTYRKITVSDMAPHVHTFLAGENKVDKILKWLINWINLSLDCGKIYPYDLLPSKADLACHIGVSQGTIQNVFRLAEDAGYLESKQRIGTFIRDKEKSGSVEKLTSKRELAIEIVKKYLKDNEYNIGDTLIPVRQLSTILGISNTTIRLAVTNLVSTGVLKKVGNNFEINNDNFNSEVIQTKTLVEKVAEYLRKYVCENFQPGEKLPPNILLAKKFKVSLKTIHDSIKILSKEGLLCTRRGRYGTVVLGKEKNDVSLEIYDYEKIEQKIRNYITQHTKVGDKLPSIKEFAISFKTSEKTVKKALDNLSDDGYITSMRGRYGGTFVLDMPQNSNEAYKWLAISSDFITN